MEVLSKLSVAFMLGAVVLSPSVFGNQVFPRSDGGADIKCDSGRTAVVRLDGTILHINIREPNGTERGLIEAPSGGSSDPQVRIGNGSNLAKRICSE